MKINDFVLVFVDKELSTYRLFISCRALIVINSNPFDDLQDP